MIKDVKELVEFQVRKNASRFSKNLLIKIEDLIFQQRILQEQVLKDIPAEYHNRIKALNILNDNQYQALRKRILDYSNDHIRDTLSELENYEINFNFVKK